MRQWLLSRGDHEFVAELEWLEGVVNVAPKITVTPTFEGPPLSPGGRTTVELQIYQEDYLLTKATKLFLSHKGADKSMVREYFSILKMLGFDPWLDEDAMAWGTNLERGILQGFKDSCAAIFFITPHFKDEGYLATEIDYAIKEKRDKGDKFAIIAVRFRDSKGNKGDVPELLTPYVYGDPKSHLKALSGILKGIPLHVGPVTWKPTRSTAAPVRCGMW